MMVNLVKTIILISLVAGILLSCNVLTPTTTVTNVPVVETAVFTTRSTKPLPPPSTATDVLVTETAVVATPSKEPFIPTATATSETERIVFYYFVQLTDAVPPQGSVVVMPDTYILAPQLSESAYSPDTAADLRTALKLALNDTRNGWTSTKLDIVDVAFHAGHTDIVLQGEYFGVGDVTLIAAKMQILMTVFANPEDQTARVTLNGDSIGNLGVSNIMYAYPNDYVFTRAEIEAYQSEHLYVSP